MCTFLHLPRLPAPQFLQVMSEDNPVHGTLKGYFRKRCALVLQHESVARRLLDLARLH